MRLSRKAGHAGLFVCALLVLQCLAASAAYGFSSPDSTGVQIKDGVLCVLHEVETGETLYAISRRYGVSVELIRKANPAIAGNAISIGQILLIPGEEEGKGSMGKANALGTDSQLHPSTGLEMPDHAAAASQVESMAQDAVLASPLPKQPADTRAVRGKSHEVKEGETLFSLSRTYAVSLVDLIQANPGIADKPLSTGVLLVIPQSDAATEQEPASSPTDRVEPELDLDSLLSEPQPRFHEVLPGETLYSIASIYPGANSPSQLRAWNRLPDNNVQPGQQIIVGWDEAPGSLARARAWVTPGPADTASGPRVTKRGIATWLDNSSGTDKDYLALHNTAPLGGVIRVRNLMNNRTVRARVIGRLPSSIDDRDSVVKLSFAAAQALGAHDPKVLVEVDYASDTEAGM